MTWFDAGFDTPHDTESSGGSGRGRFWLPQNKDGEDPIIKKVCFLDALPFRCYEHSPKIGGDFRNYFTCVQGLEEYCPICRWGDKNKDSKGYSLYRRYPIGVWSVIDMDKWTDKEGKPHVNERKLLVAKKDSVKDFKLKAKMRDGLKGCIFSVSRPNKVPSIGGSWEFDRKVDPAAEFGHDVVTDAFDYEERFAPISLDELKAKCHSFDGGSNHGDQPSEDADVPF